MEEGDGPEQTPDPLPLVPSTKQMLVDVIQSQPGDSLPEILWTLASEHEVGCARLLLGMS